MSSLKAIIEGEIEQQGSITVERYMQLCLQHPTFGYYRRAAAIGKQADFITAPEISQIFGDLLGMWVATAAQNYDLDFYLVELGGGTGRLSTDMMRILNQQSLSPTLHIVESSDYLKTQQADMLRDYNVIWHSQLESLPSDKPLIIIANEFFDAMPIRQFCGEDEQQVTYIDNKFEFMSDESVTKEESPAAQAILKAICERIGAQRGVMLLIDYGYEQTNIADAKSCDSLQAMRGHDYADPLTQCGEVDLTAHVDFTALQKVARENNCHSSEVVAQGTFLQRLGGDLWLQKLMQPMENLQQKMLLETGWLRLIAPAQMGELFKVMAIHSEPEMKLAGFES